MGGKTEGQKSDFVKMLFGNAQSSVPLFVVVQKWHLGEVGGGTGEGFRYTGGGPSTVRQVHCKGIRMASYG